MGCKVLKLLFILVLFTTLIAELNGYQFKVGGKEGWVITPSENYNHWAERTRFQVNDTLSVFRYKKGTDSVLVVNQGDYDKCNTQNPITTSDGGDSVFMFERSGPFFFISGTKDHGDKDQKLIIVVLAVRNKAPPGPPPPVVLSPAPAPEGHVPSVPPTPTPTPASSEPTASGPGSPSSLPGGTPGSATSPPRSAGDVVIPSIILISTVTIVMSFIA